MLRPAVLLAPLSGILCHRASTLGSLHQLPVSYEATWLLPRLNFHQLVVPSLARRAILKKEMAFRQKAFLYRSQLLGFAVI